MSFFGFDTTLPNRRQDGGASGAGNGNGRFASAGDIDLFSGGSGGVGAQEDIAVYTWGTDDYNGLGNALIEGGDEANNTTFGDPLPVTKDFVFSHHQGGQGLSSKPTTTLSMSSSRNRATGLGGKSKKANANDMFASTEADFLSAPKKSKSNLVARTSSLLFFFWDQCSDKSLLSTFFQAHVLSRTSFPHLLRPVSPRLPPRIRSTSCLPPRKLNPKSEHLLKLRPRCWPKLLL